MNMSICAQCPMNSARKIQVQTIGSGPCELLLVGYSPNWTDANTMAPFTGNQYNWIWSLLSSIDVSFYVTTLFKCKSNTVDYHCINQFYDEVAQLKPKCILFLGEKTLTTVVPDAKFSEYRDFSHQVDNLGDSRVLATYDPTYVSEDNEIVYDRFIDDLVYACRHAAAYRTEGKYISRTITADQFHRVVDLWLNDPSIEYVSFDSESNGLDPLLDNLLITSFSVSVDGKSGYNIFLYHPEMLDTITDDMRKSIIEDAKRLLTQKKIVVHHAKHEHRLIKVLWGFTPNITEDTMYMSYILYLSYPGISHGLKYLSGRFISMPPWEEVLQRFVALFKALKRHKNLPSIEGLEDYRSSMSDIVSLSNDDIINFWQILHDPDYPMAAEQCEMNTDPYYWLVPSKVMERYAGMDAIAPLQLMYKFKPIIDADPGLSKAYRLMVDGAETFANVELHGVRLVALDDWTRRYDQKIEETLNILRSYDEVKDYEEKSGVIFNPSSSKVLSSIMYDTMKFPVLDRTDKGAPRTNETVLIDMIKKYREVVDSGNASQEDQRRLTFIETLRDYKKYAKIKSAYWEGLKSFIHQGKAFDGHRCEYYKIEGDIDSKGRSDIINPGYMLHGTDSIIAGTMIMTSDGLRSIESLSSCKDYDNLPKGFYPLENPEIEVYDGEVWRSPMNFYYGGKRRVVKITTKDGGELTGTYEHPILTNKGWVPLADLTRKHIIYRVNPDNTQSDYIKTRISKVEYLHDQVDVFDLVMDLPEGGD